MYSCRSDSTANYVDKRRTTAMKHTKLNGAEHIARAKVDPKENGAWEQSVFVERLMPLIKLQRHAIIRRIKRKMILLQRWMLNSLQATVNIATTIMVTVSTGMSWIEFRNNGGLRDIAGSMTDSVRMQMTSGKIRENSGKCPVKSGECVHYIWKIPGTCQTPFRYRLDKWWANKNGLIVEFLPTSHRLNIFGYLNGHKSTMALSGANDWTFLGMFLRQNQNHGISLRSDLQRLSRKTKECENNLVLQTEEAISGSHCTVCI